MALRRPPAPQLGGGGGRAPSWRGSQLLAQPELGGNEYICGVPRARREGRAFKCCRVGPRERPGSAGSCRPGRVIPGPVGHPGGGNRTVGGELKPSGRFRVWAVAGATARTWRTWSPGLLPRRGSLPRRRPAAAGALSRPAARDSEDSDERRVRPGRGDRDGRLDSEAFTGKISSDVIAKPVPEDCDRRRRRNVGNLR